MFDFQKEIANQEITVSNIDLVCTALFPGEEPYEWNYAETYKIGNILILSEFGQPVEEISKFFKLQILLEIKQYILNAHSINELIEKVKILSQKDDWFNSDHVELKIENPKTNTLDKELAFADIAFPAKDFKELNEIEAVEYFKQRKGQIHHRINYKVNNYISSIINEVLQSSLITELEEKLISTKGSNNLASSTKDQDNYKKSLGQIMVKPNNVVEFENDLWDMLKSHDYLGPEVAKHQFKALFGKGLSETQKLNWQDTLSTLALFLKNLPLEIDNLAQTGASLFTCKGKAITNSQITNNGRTPKSKKEADLVNFLEDLVSTFS